MSRNTSGRCDTPTPEGVGFSGLLPSYRRPFLARVPASTQNLLAQDTMLGDFSAF